jgi:hypothetical protein
MRRVVSWRLIWLLPAALLFAGAGHQFAEHRAVITRFAHRPRAAVPPTVYGEHSGLALALACIGLVFVILAFRRPRAPGSP